MSLASTIIYELTYLSRAYVARALCIFLIVLCTGTHSSWSYSNTYINLGAGYVVGGVANYAMFNSAIYDLITGLSSGFIFSDAQTIPQNVSMSNVPGTATSAKIGHRLFGTLSIELEGIYVNSDDESRERAPHMVAGSIEHQNNAALIRNRYLVGMINGSTDVVHSAILDVYIGGGVGFAGVSTDGYYQTDMALAVINAAQEIASIIEAPSSVSATDLLGLVFTWQLFTGLCIKRAGFSVGLSTRYINTPYEVPYHYRTQDIPVDTTAFEIALPTKPGIVSDPNNILGGEDRITQKFFSKNHALISGPLLKNRALNLITVQITVGYNFNMF